MKHSPKGVLLVLLSALMFGSYGVWSRLMGSSFGIFYQGWTRAVIICLILFPFLYFTKQIVPIKKGDLGWLSVYLIFTSATQAPLYYAFNHMDIGSATLLFFVSMLLTMYSVGFLFLREKVTFIKILSFIIAILGLLITFSFSTSAFTILAVAMAVLNGIASGGEISFSKKLSSYSALYLTWLSWLVIAITNSILSVSLKEIQHIPSLDIAWAYQLGYVVAGIIGFWAVVEGIKRLEASIGGLIGLVEIIVSIGMGIIVFHEGLTPRILQGAFLIILAAALPHVVDLIKSRYIQTPFIN
jgi:drug/metabolite transporter (DMT)-like permease